MVSLLELYDGEEGGLYGREGGGRRVFGVASQKISQSLAWGLSIGFEGLNSSKSSNWYEVGGLFLIIETLKSY